MSIDLNEDRKELNAKLNAIKGYLDSKEQKLKQDLNNLSDNFFNDSTTQTYLLNSVNQSSTNRNVKKNAFEDLIDILFSSIGSSGIIAGATQQNYLRQPALQAITEISKKINDIVRDEFLNSLYVSTIYGCGVDANITSSSINIKPEEFDLFGQLKIDPSSSMGQAIYESQNFPTNLYPFPLNKLFYVTFQGGTQTFSSKSNSLFSMVWDAPNQQYTVSNISNVNVYNFIVEYFSSINVYDKKQFYSNITSLMSGTVSTQRNNEYMNNVNLFSRLTSRIFNFCPQAQTQPNNFTTDNLKEFNDVPIEVQDLFNFDDTDNIFFSEETLRFNRVIKFKDCNNVEIPVNEQMVEDFFNDFDRNAGNDTYVDNFLNDMSYDAFQNMNGSVPMDMLRTNLNLNFIKSLPKALAMMIFSPKVLFPFILIRKIFGADPINGKAILNIVYKTIFIIIRKIFEEFIAHFFKLIKKEIVKLIGVILSDTISEIKNKRIFIIQSLLGVFSSLLQTGNSGLSVCGGLIKTILGLLSTNIKIPFSVPTPLLLAAEYRSGFSNIRAFINVVEELNKVGIPTGDLFGQPNKYVIGHLAHITAVERERSENSVVKSTLTVGTIATPSGPAVVVPGTLTAIGIIN